MKTLENAVSDRNIGYWLLAFGGILVFATAWVSLVNPPAILMDHAFYEWLNQFDGILIMPWALYLLAFGSALTVLGAFSSSFGRRTKILLTVSGTYVLFQSVLALLFGSHIVGVPDWMLRNSVYWGSDKIPVVQLYTQFYFLAMGLGLVISFVGLYSLGHRFPGLRGAITRVGIFCLGFFCIVMLKGFMFFMP